MRRSTKGPAPQAAEDDARGNFTPRSRGAAQAPAADVPEDPGTGGSGMSVRNWRVATRLNAILLVPVLVALVLGGLRVSDSITTWGEAQDAQRTAEVVQAASVYANALLEERDLTVKPLLEGRRSDSLVKKTRAATDAAKGKFDEAVGNMPDNPGLERRLTSVRNAESEFTQIRKSAYTQGGVETEEGYIQLQQPLMAFANELGYGTGNGASYGRSVYAVALSKSALSLQRAIGMHLLVKAGPSEQDRQRQLTAFSSYAYLEGIAVAEFTSGGRPQDLAMLRDEAAKATEEGAERAAAAKKEAERANQPFVTPPQREDMVQAIGSGQTVDQMKTRGVTEQSWFATATGAFEAYHNVEDKLTAEAVDETEQIAADARNDAIIDGTIVVLALLLAFLIAAMMARSMGRSMQSLRYAALDVADKRLPALVEKLSHNGRVDTRVAPVPITSTDEIGQIARAFDRVHREAVRLAGEQAMLRGNVNAIFTNLSRRNQGLIESQLALVTELENNEADPDQLENLFRMDHLATRMRRNGENLLVLAGEDPGRQWNQPVPLVDILRAASSEVEHYERIEFSGVPETEIHGRAVTDLVHLLAELLENATSFSSPQTKVRVAATRLPDGRVMIEIHDKGIGLTAEDFADINHRLSVPPTVTAAVSERMGLYVVGRLSDRHGIRVQLRPSAEQSGTTSLVMLPDAITHGGGDDHAEEDFTVSRIVGEQPGAAQPAAWGARPRSAAELGFDDSAYGRPELPSQPGAPAPAGHALHREERQAETQGAYSAEAYPQEQYPQEQYPQGGYEQNGYSQEGYAQDGQGGYTADRNAYPQNDDYGYSEAGYAPGSAAPADGSYTAAYDDYSQPQPRLDAGFGGGADPSGAPQGLAARGPSPSSAGSPTGSGLPRREAPSGPRASLHDPESGGTTHSGLPKRVPRANLVESTPEQNTQGGPQVSRAPEDVRGRLSNLHRGVLRGRNAGEARQNERPGSMPGSTYEQER